MIFDDVSRLSRYLWIPHLDHVIRFLDRADLLFLKEPELEIFGRELFVRKMTYEPKPAAANRFETHRVYADIQVLLKGREIMQLAQAQDLKPTTEYDSTNDYQFFTVEENITDLAVNAGQFVVFFPGEPHRPSCRYADDKGENTKLVFKIKMGQP